MGNPSIEGTKNAAIGISAATKKAVVSVASGTAHAAVVTKDAVVELAVASAGVNSYGTNVDGAVDATGAIHDTVDVTEEVFIAGADATKKMYFPAP
eukprot:scaffold174753_cov36-Attheya_sp.AAC.1